MVSILLENNDGFLIADNSHHYEWSELVNSSNLALATIVLFDRSKHYIGRVLNGDDFILGRVDMETGIMQTTDDEDMSVDFNCFQILTCNATVANNSNIVPSLFTSNETKCGECPCRKQFLFFSFFFEIMSFS